MARPHRIRKERREIIQYKNIPDVLREAILSAEDENFFSHAEWIFRLSANARSMTIHALMARGGGSNGENAGERAQRFPKAGSTIRNSLCGGLLPAKTYKHENEQYASTPGALRARLAFVIGTPGANRFC